MIDQGCDHKDAFISLDLFSRKQKRIESEPCSSIELSKSYEMAHLLASLSSSLASKELKYTVQFVAFQECIYIYSGVQLCT